MGISLCYFELVALELDLKGKWEARDGIRKNKNYDMLSSVDYIISWNGA